MADVVARDREIGVGGVLPPGEAARRQKGAQIGIAQIEKRTDERDAVHVRDRLEPRQTVRAGAAGEAENEGFRNIVGMMACGNGVQGELTGHAGEKGQPDATGGHFNGLSPAAADPRADGVEGQVEMRGTLLNKTRVFFRFAPQAVVNMQDERFEAVFILERAHQFQKGHGVRTAGNGQPDSAFARFELM